MDRFLASIYGSPLAPYMKSSALLIQRIERGLSPLPLIPSPTYARVEAMSSTFVRCRLAQLTLKKSNCFKQPMSRIKASQIRFLTVCRRKRHFLSQTSLLTSVAKWADWARNRSEINSFGSPVISIQSLIFATEFYWRRCESELVVLYKFHTSTSFAESSTKLTL